MDIIYAADASNHDINALFGEKKHTSITDGEYAACKHYIGCRAGSCATIHCTRTSKNITRILRQEGFKV